MGNSGETVPQLYVMEENMLEILYLLNCRQELHDLVKYNMTLNEVAEERAKMLKVSTHIAKLDYILILLLLLVLLVLILNARVIPSIIITSVGIMLGVFRCVAANFKRNMILQHHSELYAKYGTGVGK